MNAITLKPLTAQQRKSFDWLSADYLSKVVKALEAVEPGSVRFVGGCVRDSLLNAEPKDFDIATTLEPQAVIDALHDAGLSAAPTGLEHGTVTAIADHHGVEVTTLRSDVSTDGRRATVAFTKDWTEDAGRRDFTVNAVYLTPDGKLFDPVGGIADADAKRIRFIGDASQRIREDYLRILRFFRFTARFAETFDSKGIKACAALKDGIDTLSAERIGAELIGIAKLPRAGFALQAMNESGVLRHVWEANPDIDAVNRLKRIAPNAAPPVVLAALFADAGEGIGARLRLSNAEKSIRSSALKCAADIKPGLSEKEARALIYRQGKDVFLDGAALACAFETIDAADYRTLHEIALNKAPPALPISGRHILEHGVSPGPAVAKILSAAEARWIGEDFPGEDRLRDIVTDEIRRAG